MVIDKKGKFDLWPFIQGRSVFMLLHNNLNIFSLETNGLIQFKFNMEYPLDEKF